MQKRRLFILILCVLALLASGAQALSGTELAVLKVGKADAILLLTASDVVLIDAGEDEDAAEILTFLAMRGISYIDVMVITHFDKDHVGGADGVLMGMKVGAVYDAAYESDSAQYEEYESALARTGVPRTRVSLPLTLKLERLTLDFMPTALETQDDNDLSLVLSVSDAYHSFLFAGDAEEARIGELLKDGLSGHDVVKMPHHGRTKRNLAEFLEALSPQIALITDSAKNPADPETLSLLADRDIDTYCTKDGDIHVISSPAGLTAMQ